MADCVTWRDGRRVRKSGYKNRRVARYYRAKYAKEYGWKVSSMNIYRCPVCGQYHVGRKRKVESEQS
jgi:hypothetical protein